MKNSILLIIFFFISFSSFAQNNKGAEILSKKGTYTAEIIKPNGDKITVQNVTVKEGKTIFVFSTKEILTVKKSDVSIVRSEYKGKEGKNSLPLPEKMVISNNSIFVLLTLAH
jgi:hypothetical protein